MALYSKTTTASTAVAFIGVDEIKSFVKTFFDPGHGHTFEIGPMFWIHVYAHTVDVIVCHAVLSPLIRIHVFQSIGQARTARGAHTDLDAKTSTTPGDVFLHAAGRFVSDCYHVFCDSLLWPL